MVYQTLIKLCIDICKRNGKNKRIWFGGKDKTLNDSPKSGILESGYRKSELAQNANISVRYEEIFVREYMEWVCMGWKVCLYEEDAGTERG